MIVTVTLNPGLDYMAETPELIKGRTNRTVSESFRPGGKGLNVSVVLSRLGMETKALGFCGGFTGEKLKSLIRLSGVDCDFMDIPGEETRINVKIITDCVTELNGMGVSFKKDQEHWLFNRVENLTKDDMLVLSGALPRGEDSSFYARIMERVSCPVVVDAVGDALLKTLPLRPVMIKPNREEVEGYFGLKDASRDQIIESLHELKKMGARNVLFSDGANEGMLLAENGVLYTALPPRTSAKLRLYTVGAGDAMVAGFIYAYKTFSEPASWLRYSLAAGTASVVGEFLADKETVERLFLQG